MITSVTSYEVTRLRSKCGRLANIVMQESVASPTLPPMPMAKSGEKPNLPSSNLRMLYAHQG